jgi:hypothetical protein
MLLPACVFIVLKGLDLHADSMKCVQHLCREAASLEITLDELNAASMGFAAAVEHSSHGDVYTPLRDALQVGNRWVWKGMSRNLLWKGGSPRCNCVDAKQSTCNP